MRMSAKRVFWEEHDIGQCITLSLADMGENENLLAAASHFWSESLNAFLFGHGPMTPTLLDVVMLTVLNISEGDRPSDTIIKPTHQLVTKGVGGWKDYIAKHAKIGSINNREHTTFLNMWL